LTDFKIYTCGSNHGYRILNCEASMGLLNSVRYFIPELVLIAEALIILIAVMFKGKRLAGMSALMGLVVSFITLLSIKQTGVTGGLFGNIITLDSVAIFFKGLCITVTFFTVLFSIKFRSGEILSSEYYAILLLATAGMCLLASANDLLMAYIALETVSISAYILTAFLKSNRKSSEAGLKYVIYGAIASGIMIYGMSLLYGITGTTNFVDINKFVGAYSDTPLLVVIILMVLAGFGYKIAAVPFHMWCPDVYEGAPTPITAFLSVGPKAAGFAILIRFLWEAFYSALVTINQITVIWQSLLMIICVLTMTIGNLCALKQTNLKRLLAYSSIAHCGYILMGVVILTKSGLEAVLIYFIIYLFMNLGAFLVIIAISEITGREDLKDYHGLGWLMPFPCVIMTIFLLSLTGLPPFAGFIGKLYLFKAVIEVKWYWLAVLGALNTVISLYYYARVIKAMFLESVDTEPSNPQSAIRNPQSSVSLYYSIILVILVIPILVLGVYWIPLLVIIQKLS